ncbi:MAG: tRNA lysidine(34) synthetase TilS [Candidatus Neomarinimicrobiota bacterium]|nr:tRNA lysidine(34) synthetase TilS [Candidatus Neomarinimicrobiota bacterium]
MKHNYIPDPKIINDSITDNILSHFDKVLYNKKNDKFLLSVSGGSDSVLLLYLFIKYLKGDNERIIISYINHNLRNDSDIDESFVSILGSKLNIETHIRHLNPNMMPKGASVESWARKGRYDLLKNIMIETGADWIITAHHANDQAETILMNISEKTGLFGLGGMKEINNNIIRPLLPFSKAYLMNIVKKYSIPYMEDSTNSNNNHKRNFIRNIVIAPWLAKDADLIEAIIKTASNFQDWQNSMLYFVKNFIAKNVFPNRNGSLYINKNELKKLPVLARLCVFQVLTNSIGLLRKSDVENIKRFFHKDIIGNICSTKNDYVLLNDRKHVIVKKKEPKETIQLELKIGEKCNFGGYNYKMNNCVDNIFFSEDPNDELLDLSVIENKKLVLRFWKPGDRFKPLGMNGNQKISDFLINNKVNIFEKDHQTVLTADGQIIWVCGYRIDDSVRISDSTKNIIRIKRKYNRV